MWSQRFQPAAFSLLPFTFHLQPQSSTLSKVLLLKQSTTLWLQIRSSLAVIPHLTLKSTTAKMLLPDVTLYQQSGTIQVGDLQINLKRTIRVPDNENANCLPPGLGNFPVYHVKDYAERMPDEMLKKGGVFFPMYRK